MMQINCVKKSKERHLFQLENMNELKYIDFNSIIPKNAKQIEIYYKDKDKILKIDYLTNLEIKGEKGGKYE